MKITRLGLQAEAVNSHWITTFGKANLDIIVLNSSNQLKTISQQYYAVDMVKYNLILGIPWHKMADPDIFWIQQEWFYKDKQSIETTLTYYWTYIGTV